MYTDTFASGEPTIGADLPSKAAGDVGKSRVAALFSAVVSVALLVVVAMQFRGLGLEHVVDMIPTQPLFWIVFAAWYLAGPISELVIYRRLWRIPLSGIGALMRKMVSNELLLGYLGEAQFYAWVRGRLDLTTAPFGAIKDVTILSALTGNIVTMAMLGLAWPIVFSSKIGMGMQSTFVSLGVVLLSSFVMLVFRHKLFSLPAPELRFITIAHLVRIAAKVGLGALLWYLVLPQVAFGLWLVLATLRMLVSRLPLIPNKDVVFAGLAVLMLGQQVEIAGLLAMIAGVVLVVHLGIGAGFALAEIVETARRRWNR